MEPLYLNMRVPDSRPHRPLTVWDPVPGFVILNVVRGQLRTL